MAKKIKGVDLEIDPHLLKQAKHFKELRHRKGLTQGQLSGEGTDHRICSKKTIGRIENGEGTPSPSVLSKLLSVLDVSYDEFQSLIYDEDIRAFNQDFARIWDVGYNKDYLKMDEMLQILNKKPYCVKHIPVVSQALLLGKGVLLSRLHKDDERALEVLLYSLQKTAPNVVSKNNDIILTQIHKRSFSLNEYRILKIVANIKAAAGKGQEALDLSYAIVVSLECEATSYEIRKKLLPTAYFNTSNTLLKNELYAQALDVATRGIDFCLSIKELKVNGELFWNKGRALHGMGDLRQATVFFQKALNFFIGHDADHTALSLINTAKDKYGIILSNN